MCPNQYLQMKVVDDIVVRHCCMSLLSPCIPSDVPQIRHEQQVVGLVSSHQQQLGSHLLRKHFSRMCEVGWHEPFLLGLLHRVACVVVVQCKINRRKHARKKQNVRPHASPNVDDLVSGSGLGSEEGHVVAEHLQVRVVRIGTCTRRIKMSLWNFRFDDV